MLIRNIFELRLYFPNHAFDESYLFAGSAYNSEIDFLKDKLGEKLYDKLNDKLESIDPDSFIAKINDNTALSYYEQLLYMCQRCVAFDSIGRTASINAISINGTGMNVATSGDYGNADTKAVDNFKLSCMKEAHTAINVLLATLESWSIKSVTIDDADLKEIVDDWKLSKYYYLANSLFIPSAVVMQEYLNFYENREKFIQMLPDLKYIQEELIESIIGPDLSDYLISAINKSTTDNVLLRLINLLRKFMTASLEARTQVIKINEKRVDEAHHEAVAYTNKISDYVSAHLDLWLVSEDADLVNAVKLTPQYIKRKEEEAKATMPLNTVVAREDDALFMPIPGIM